MVKYNKTSLNVEKANERGIIHRDYLAHALRWSHVMRHIKIIRNRRMNILDVGCGEHYPLLKTLYTNKKLAYVNYVGFDLKKVNVNMNFGKYQNCFNIYQLDVSKPWYTRIPDDGGWDIITCFELIEHMPKKNGIAVLENIKEQMWSHTKFFLSTPCFNGKAAANHIYEWEYRELEIQLESMFNIVARYGTFASQRDIEPVLLNVEREVYDKLKNYYDSNVLSLLMAPLHPGVSRNVFWHLEVK